MKILLIPTLLLNTYVNFMCQKNDTLKTFEKTVGVSIQYEIPNQINSKFYTDSLIALYQNKDLSRFLTIENSIYIKTYGLGGLASISKRGASSSQTQLQWNGIPVNSSTLGMQDLSILPILFVDNITIENGSVANGGLEGGINLRNSAVFSKKTMLSYTKELGSFGMDKTLLKGNYGQKKWQASTAIFKQEATNNFTFQDYGQQGKPLIERTNAQVKGWGLSQNVYVKIKKFDVSLLSNYVNYNRQIPAAIGVMNNTAFQLDESLKTAVKIKLSTKTAQHIQLGYIADNTSYIDSIASIFSTIKTTLKSLQYELDNYVLYKNFSVFGALNLFQNNAVSSGFDANKTQNKLNAQIGIAHKNYLHNLQIILRQEVIDSIVAPFMPSIHFNKTFKNEALMILGQLYSNYRYPTLNDLYWTPGGNENLLPEKSLGGEIGFKTIHNSCFLHFTYFYSLTDNWIQWLPSNLGYWTPQNIKTVERQGVEINTHKKFTINKSQHFTVNGNYTFVKAVNKNVSQQNEASLNKQLIYVPKHTLGLSASYNFKNVEVIYQQQLYSKTYIDAVNSTYLPYIAPASLQIGGTLADKNTAAYFALKIENIFNETYQIIANQPLPGRYFSVLIRLSLKSN